MRQTVHTRALERAAQMLGGERVLAQHLNVSRVRLRWWMGGTAELPDAVFLKLVDLLLDRDIAGLTHDISRAAARHRV